METRLRIVTWIAIVATAAAVIEGVALVKLSRRASQPATTQPAATAVDVAKPIAAETQNAIASGEEPAEPVSAPPEAKRIDAGAAEAAAPASSNGLGEPKAAEAPEASQEEEASLSDEERAARRTAEDKARMEQAMVLMAETNVNKMLDGLKLTEAQREQAAPVREKLCGIMLGMMVGPHDKSEALQRRATEMRESGQFTDEQIHQALKPEQDALLQGVFDGMTDMEVALDELAPILDATQTEALTVMQTQMKQSQETMKKMFEQMKPQQGN